MLAQRNLVVRVHTCCPSCGSSHRQVKNGSSEGHALKKCQDCGKVYAVENRERGYSAATRLEAVRLYVDGVNLRRIGRILGVNPQSVANWVKAHHGALSEKAPDFPSANIAPSAMVTQAKDEAAGSHSLAVVEGDEIFTFLSSKKTGHTS